MEKTEFYRHARADLPGPLSGVRVLEATTTWAGPLYAAVSGLVKPVALDSAEHLKHQGWLDLRDVLVAAPRKDSPLQMLSRFCERVLFQVPTLVLQPFFRDGSKRGASGSLFRAA